MIYALIFYQKLWLKICNFREKQPGHSKFWWSEKIEGLKENLLYWLGGWGWGEVQVCNHQNLVFPLRTSMTSWSQVKTLNSHSGWKGEDWGNLSSHLNQVNVLTHSTRYPQLCWCQDSSERDGSADFDHPDLPVIFFKRYGGSGGALLPTSSHPDFLFKRTDPPVPPELTLPCTCPGKEGS